MTADPSVPWGLLKIAQQFIAGYCRDEGKRKPFPAMNCGAIFRSPSGTKKCLPATKHLLNPISDLLSVINAEGRFPEADMSGIRLIASFERAFLNTLPAKGP
jgi:hypothetical protein